MKTIETFIFVHDQNIIMEYKSIKKFDLLPNLKFVLVGKNNFDLVRNHEDVIICQNFEDNIEDFPKFTSYTGWYILWKHKLITSDYINLFEYDINIKPNITSIFKKIQSSELEFIGYLPVSMHEPCFIKDKIWTEKMVESIKKNYSVDMYFYINKLLRENPNSIWSSTSNSTFNKQTFLEYMEWFYDIFLDLRNFEFSGHAHERSLSFFYLLRKSKISMFPGFIDHFQLNSHGTSPLLKNRFNQLYNNLL